MSDKNIEIRYETINIPNQRYLIEVTRDLSKALTPEEYTAIMSIYSQVLIRLSLAAEEQGIEI